MQVWGGRRAIGNMQESGGAKAGRLRLPVLPALPACPHVHTAPHCLPASCRHPSPPPFPADLWRPSADVLDLRREHQRALQARTVLGHVQNLLGYILSLYCIYRWVGGQWGGCGC